MDGKVFRKVGFNRMTLSPSIRFSRNRKVTIVVLIFIFIFPTPVIGSSIYETNFKQKCAAVWQGIDASYSALERATSELEFAKTSTDFIYAVQKPLLFNRFDCLNQGHTHIYQEHQAKLDTFKNLVYYWQNQISRGALVSLPPLPFKSVHVDSRCTTSWLLSPHIPDCTIYLEG
jgi:hypothetical protein